MDGMAIYFLIVYMYMYAVIKSNDMRVSNDSRGVQNHKKNINKIEFSKCMYLTIH